MTHVLHFGMFVNTEYIDSMHVKLHWNINKFRDDGSGCPSFTRFNFDFTPIVGQTYIFGISGFGSSTGNYRLTATCTPFNSINRTLSPTSQPTLSPTIFNTITTLAPNITGGPFIEQIFVNGTQSPENVTVCFDIQRVCFQPTLSVLYIPIDYDGIDEPNEYVRVSNDLFSYDCARNVANNCSTIETCGLYSFGSIWFTPADACITFEIGGDVDNQCNSTIGFDISDRTFFGLAELYCKNPLGPDMTPSPTVPTNETFFISCGQTIVGSTQLPGNFEDRFPFVLPYPGTITFDTCGSSFDTFARVYDAFGITVGGWYITYISVYIVIIY